METFKTFISLLALINPLGAIPLFISLTAHQTPPERRQTIFTASVTVALVVAVSSLLGQQVISFFGISIASLQVGGGIIMLLMAISMLNAQMGAARATPEETVEASTKEAIAVVPLAIPMLTGPGTISTVIIYADRAVHWYELLGLIGCGVALAVLTWAALNLATPISRLMGRTGINVATRLMGLMLAALAVEFIVDGLTELIPALRK